MSPGGETDFLFASFDSKKPQTARRVHIRRLYDILQLCLHRNDVPRARRAWAILARCKETDWKTMWTTGVLLCGDVNDLKGNTQRLDFLRAMILQNPDEEEAIRTELVLRLILSGKYNEALDELETYLPSFPYQDNPVLHIYAGLVCLYLAQPSAWSPNEGDDVNEVNRDRFNPIQLRQAEAHLERAKALDKDNVVANAFLKKIALLLRSPEDAHLLEHESDDETIDFGNSLQPRKRVRT